MAASAITTRMPSTKRIRPGPWLSAAAPSFEATPKSATSAEFAYAFSGETTDENNDKTLAISVKTSVSAAVCPASRARSAARGAAPASLAVPTTWATWAVPAALVAPVLFVLALLDAELPEMTPFFAAALDFVVAVPVDDTISSLASVCPVASCEGDEEPSPAFPELSSAVEPAFLLPAFPLFVLDFPLPLVLELPLPFVLEPELPLPFVPELSLSGEAHAA